MKGCGSTLFLDVFVLMGVIFPPACSVREQTSDSQLGASETKVFEAGDPIIDLFTEGTAMYMAVSTNMFAITGGKNKAGGISQEVSFRRMEPWNQHGYNKDLQIAVYFCKKNDAEPVKATAPSRASYKHIQAVGDSSANFQLAGIQEIGIEVFFTETKFVKPTGQPIISATGNFFTMYGGGALATPCYMIAAHSHQLEYGNFASVPTDLQFLGTTDEAWFSEDSDKAPPKETTLCGACVTATWAWSAFGQPSIASYDMGPCTQKRSEENPVSFKK